VSGPGLFRLARRRPAGGSGAFAPGGSKGVTVSLIDSVSSGGGAVIKPVPPQDLDTAKLY